MPDIAATAAQLCADDLPVIFLDTCILLDVIRAIKRKYPNCVSCAHQLHSLATGAGRQFNVVVSHIVRHEWSMNEPGVLAEATGHLKEIEDQALHFDAACSVLGVTPGFGPANYAGHNVAVQLRELSRQLLDSGIAVTQDDGCSARAIQRVLYNTAPANKGGQAKDCTILEEYLAVCSQVHATGFARNLVFCTSNTNDYCGKIGLHAILAAEFATVGLSFTTNLPWGLHILSH